MIAHILRIFTKAITPPTPAPESNTVSVRQYARRKPRKSAAYVATHERLRAEMGR